MRRWLIGLFAGILFAGILLSGGVSEALGAIGKLHYWGSDPYVVLTEAQRQRKLLLVEFYAPWNHRSRWMNEKVLSDSSVRALLESDFLAVQVSTDTEEGGKLAELYEVTRYPALVIFNYNGTVLDKIDATLDTEDFKQRINALLLTLRGGGATWRLSQVYTAAETGNRAIADQAAARYLASQTPEQVINSVVWPLFRNRIVTYYYSSTFDYLLFHLDRFREQIGAEEVDRDLSEVLTSGLLPYLLGTQPYSQGEVQQLVAVAERSQLAVLPLLETMSQVAALRSEGSLSLYVSQLGLLLNRVPESMRFPLLLSLEIVTGKGSREERQAAYRLVSHHSSIAASPQDSRVLEELCERLK